MKTTEADLAIDLRTKLKETVDAISYLDLIGSPIPDEAHEIAGILRRAIVAEERVKGLEKVLEAHRRFHDKAGCSGRPECYVCAEEEFLEAHHEPA